ncbi:MAG TPA: BatA domain-containing protein [Flavobacteriaceae bacterium]|nr:BatA domain-containing protein [Flavobacteriaceae bacterium]
MQFKHPELLYALFLLLIPIIVHLFQLRKFKKETFTNVAFLKQLTLQTRKSSQLKKWLILATRLLALSALIFAFAQPYTSAVSAIEQEAETVVYIDNSFSMQKKGASGELLKRALQELLTHSDENRTVSLFTNTDTYRNTTVKALRNELLQTGYTAQQLSYNAVLLKATDLFSKNSTARKQLLMISDFQEQKEVFEPNPDASIQLHLVKLSPVNTKNIVLDSLYISAVSPSVIELSATIKSNTATEEAVAVSLFDDNRLIAKTGVTVNNEATAVFSIPANETLNGKVTLTDAELEFDNTLYFSIAQKPKINVLSISDADASFLSRIFTDNEFTYSSYTSKNIDFSMLASQDVIISYQLDTVPNALSTALQNFEANGGTLIIIPSTSSSTASYNQLLAPYGWAMGAKQETEKRITRIQYSHPVFTEVFNDEVANFQYPSVKSYYPLSMNKSASMLLLEDGNPFLAQQGSCYLFTAALAQENSNFTQSDLVVTLYAIARNSLKIPRLYYTVGENTYFDVDITLQQDEIVTLKNEETTVIPRQQYYNNKVSIYTGEAPEKAGIYELRSADEVLQSISFNYNRQESNLSYQNITAETGFSVSHSVERLLTDLKNKSKINALWKWFVIFALVFLITELLILKYLK